MKVEEVKSIKIEYEGGDIDTFKSTIDKVHAESAKAGFGSSFTADEKKLIEDLNVKLNPKPIYGKTHQ